MKNKQVITAKEIKRLPAGTEINIIRESDGQIRIAEVVNCGKRKMLRGPRGLSYIKDIPGYLYELRTEEKNE